MDDDWLFEICNHKVISAAALVATACVSLGEQGCGYKLSDEAAASCSQ